MVSIPSTENNCLNLRYKKNKHEDLIKAMFQWDKSGIKIGVVPQCPDTIVYRPFIMTKTLPQDPWQIKYKIIRSSDQLIKSNELIPIFYDFYRSISQNTPRYAYRLVIPLLFLLFLLGLEFKVSTLKELIEKITGIKITEETLRTYIVRKLQPKNFVKSSGNGWYFFTPDKIYRWYFKVLRKEFLQEKFSSKEYHMAYYPTKIPLSEKLIIVVQKYNTSIHQYCNKIISVSERYMNKKRSILGIFTVILLILSFLSVNHELFDPQINQPIVDTSSTTPNENHPSTPQQSFNNTEILKIQTLWNPLDPNGLRRTVVANFSVNKNYSVNAVIVGIVAISPPTPSYCNVEIRNTSIEGALLAQGTTLLSYPTSNLSIFVWYTIDLTSELVLYSQTIYYFIFRIPMAKDGSYEQYWLAYSPDNYTGNIMSVSVRSNSEWREIQGDLLIMLKKTPGSCF